MKHKTFTLAVLFIFSVLSISSNAQTGFGISEKGTLNSYPYILKRLVNDSFDYFQMGKNNWQYTNFEGVDFSQNPPIFDNAVMWPKSWWQQFNYASPPYPLYPLEWRFKLSSSFPDWPLFVETFGELYCYLNSPLYQRRIFNPVAEKFWFLKSNKWAGSCYGLAASSILAFSSELELKQRFPTLGNFDNLYSVIMNNNVRKVINLLWTVQWNELSQVNIDQNRNKTPLQTLEDLKSVLYYPNQENVILCLLNQAPEKSGGHAVLPYLIREGSNIDTIEIYDSNHPIPKRILINKQDSTWDYYIGNDQWGGGKGLFLSESLTGYLDFIPPPKTFTLESNPIISIYSDTDDAILITNMNQTNEYILYNPLDTSLVNTFSFGRPIINFTGSNSPPVGYRLYDGEYKIELSSKFDSSSSISVMRDNILISYSRNDFDSSETDLIKVKGDSLMVQNIDLVNKVIDIQYISEENDDFRTYAISNLVLSQNDSLTSKINSSHEFILTNQGQVKNYDLEIVFQSAEREDLFTHQDIYLTSNSVHKIVPDWDSLVSAPVKILIDTDGDGTYDDSIFVNNQTTSINRDINQFPTEYKLDQNYPNPFNPNTMISFELPSEAQTKLSVYNVLGELIFVLENQRLSAGRYEYEFNASGLPTGVYLYKLQTDDFTEFKKMVYLK